MEVEGPDTKKSKPSRPVLRVKKNDESAILPSKAHASDSGYDISVIRVAKDYGNGVKLYDTGLSLAFQDEHHYVDLVARSSLMKQGYMLANSVGIIDNSYRGPLMVGLYKFDSNAGELQLPARVAQLIPRQVISVDIAQVEELDETVRGQGGFGSTGK